MKCLLLLILLSFAACNGSSGNSSPKIASGDIAASQTAKAFIKNSQNEIPSSLQVNHSDLQSLSQEGLVTPEEASQISENL